MNGLNRPLVLALEGTVGLFAAIGVYAISFSPADISTTLIALAALVTAIGTAISSIMASRRVAAKVVEVVAKTDENTAATLNAVTKIDEVKVETEVIKGHVNSAASAALAREHALQDQIKALKDLIAERKEIAAVLAQAQSTAAPVIRVEHETVSELGKTTAKTLEVVKETNVDVKKLGEGQTP